MPTGRRRGSLIGRYLGLDEGRESRRGFVIRHLFLGPLWEQAVIAITMIPTYVAMLTFPYGLWLSDQYPLSKLPTQLSLTDDKVLDLSLRISIFLLNMYIGGRIFAALHLPGHFVTLNKRRRAERLCRSMERSWIWGDRGTARITARSLLQVSQELWALAPRTVDRFRQALCLFVLASDERLALDERSRLRKQAAKAGSEIPYHPNDIWDGDEFSKMVQGVPDVAGSARPWVTGDNCDD
jgi:hypothetical protein